MEAKRAAGDGDEHAVAAEPRVPGDFDIPSRGVGADSAAEPRVPGEFDVPSRGVGADSAAEGGEVLEPDNPFRGVEPPLRAEPPPTAEPTGAGRRGVSPLAVVGLVILAALLAVGGFLGWQVFGTTFLARDTAAQSVDALRESWAAATPPAAPSPGTSGEPELPVPTLPPPGEVAWLLSVPALHLEWPIVSGVEPDLLVGAVGWYPSTALPGQVGNFALAGLRVTHGEPFGQLLDLAVGDEVIIETAEAVYTYRITLPPAQLTVHRDDSWVLDPVPGMPDLAPTEALITLTTHEDLIDSPDRSVGFGVLENTEPKP